MLKKLMLKLITLIITMVFMVSYTTSALAVPITINAHAEVGINPNINLTCAASEEKETTSLWFVVRVQGKPDQVIQQINVGEYPKKVDTGASTVIYNNGNNAAKCW
ncbi:hypothetical protein [Nostoc sp. PCC 7107]|uniref:hypothetical protein n=1 Tax=Nostoc sp. PCC 7107 TaxID=317936 RepID=UPI00029EF3A1|nr:hypothetical protein [Nostoc sp. PCC 7107]AFY43917.1 hypothetical protein Nos7107_3337 [Nostoc sp. PCC 7107]